MTKAVFLVSSSDNTFDVFEIVGRRLAQSLPVENYELYVGLNERPAFTPYRVLRAKPSVWANELYQQVELLPASVSKIVLILDDFWFYEPLDRGYIDLMLEKFDTVNADYLRLVPLKRSLFLALIRRIFSVGSGRRDCIEKIEPHEPYYSSLQIAIWRRDYLQELLGASGSIWDFEHKRTLESAHFAVTAKVLKYDHLVEKGKWYPFALPLIVGFNDKFLAQRQIDERYGIFRIFFDNLRFCVFGYSIFRARRFLKKWILLR